MTEIKRCEGPLCTIRDYLAWALASAALSIATPWYRAMIGGAIRYGLEAAKREVGGNDG